jgi:hypothetical protein
MIADELETLLPGQYKALEESRRAALTDDQRKAIDVPMMDRNEAQQQAASAAESQLAVTWKMVARQAPADMRAKAEELAREYTEAQERATMIERYRDIVNFDFWKASCEAEVTEPALEARERTWRADKEFEAARLQSAKKAYEESFAAWRKVLDASKVLREDSLTADDIAEVVGRYRKLLEQLDEPFPTPFVLQDILDRSAPQP